LRGSAVRITKTKTTNLCQGTKVDVLRTTTSYFDKGWNALVHQKDGSIQWIPEQIVGIGEDFHRQVDDDKVKTTVCLVVPPDVRPSGGVGLTSDA
jgi:hypothetical protein